MIYVISSAFPLYALIQVLFRVYILSRQFLNLCFFAFCIAHILYKIFNCFILFYIDT